MIRRFRKVSSNLYRGSAPSVSDVHMLKKMGIKKIVSLDEVSGKRIDRATKLLGMKHIMFPINIDRRSSLIKFLRQDIHKLFDQNGPTFVHCAQGKDRTGLAVALYRCKEQAWPCEKAIKEAKSLGFGIGVPHQITSLYIKLIKKVCGCKDKDIKDISFAYDIVSNERDEPGISGDYTSNLSWSPYEDYRVKEINQYIDWPEQYKSRQDIQDDEPDVEMDYGHGFPQAGGWDTSTNGIMGAGPSMIGSWYI